MAMTVTTEPSTLREAASSTARFKRVCNSAKTLKLSTELHMPTVDPKSKT